ncbi:MAG: DUF460 domain-containing protein [Thermofilaceae archaeon]
MLRKIIGIDLLPGESPISTKNPRFSYALLVDGTIKEKGEANLHYVLDLADKVRVDAIAVDNVYEIAPTIEELQILFNALNYTPKLVQVTIIGDKTYPLNLLAASLGLSNEKLSSEQAAEIAAMLCHMGVGSELVLFERDETKIIIAKGRHPSQGGMSLERYKRGVERLLLQKTREIREILDKRGMDYDVFIAKTRFGVERAVFIVYSSRDSLFGIVKPTRDHDLQLKIELVCKKNPVFVPLTKQPSRVRKNLDYLIVGVDPGITTGIAVLTLRGELKLLTSGRELSRGHVTRLLMAYGNPVILATDVVPAPVYVRKLGSMLNAVLITPSINLTAEEKRRLVNEYSETKNVNVLVENSHQRDALAAAIYAFRKLSPKLNEARDKVRKLGLDIPEEEVEVLVAKGLTIWDAIRNITRKYYMPEVEIEVPEKISSHPNNKVIQTLYDKIYSMNRRIKELENEKNELIYKLKVLEEQYQKILNFQNFVLKRDKMIEILNNRLNNLMLDLSKLNHELNRKKEEVGCLKSILEQTALGELILVPRVNDAKKLLETPFPTGIAVIETIKPSDDKLIATSVNKQKLKALICESGYNDYYAKLLARYDAVLLSEKDVKALYKLGNVNVYNACELEEIVITKLRESSEEVSKMLKDSIKTLLENYKSERARFIKSKQESP